MHAFGWDARWIPWINRSSRNVFLDWILPPIAHYGYMYIGVHFPSAVMGGMLIGLAVGLGGTALGGRWWKREHATS